LIGLGLLVSTCPSAEIPVRESASAVFMGEELVRVSIQKLIVGPATRNILSIKKFFVETWAPVQAEIFRNSRFLTFTLHLPG